VRKAMLELGVTLDELATFPNRVERLFGAFTQDQWHWAPPSWEGIPSERLTVVEQICHLRDIEAEGYSVRFDRTLREEAPSLADLPGEAMARARQYATQDPWDALREFARARARNVETLRGLSANELTRVAIFEGRPTSLHGLVHFLASHDYQHLAGLEWLIAKSEQEGVGA
jgi:hypothetical protein